MIVFISNFLNHHQANVCIELAKRDKFYFIASMPVAEEQLNLGYADLNNQYDYVVRMYESSEQKEIAQKLLNEADVVIAGSCAFPFEMIVPRLDIDKLTFWFSERLFKISWLELFYPPKLKRVLTQCTKYRNNKNYYLLCAGAFVANDYKWYNAFKDKSFTWGYFPDFIEKTESELLKPKSNDKLHILWAGRYLKWKRPEFALYAAETLMKQGIDFEIHMIGTGVLYNTIGDEIKRKHLEQYVIQCGALPYMKVREEMDKSDIFLFTSTRREGWGAVLNESMNSGCAVIADERIGAAKSMIEDGKNGLLFNGKSQFKEKLLELAANRKMIMNMGMNAYDTIASLWNANIAAERFYDTTRLLVCGSNAMIYNNGLMTKSPWEKI